MATTNERTVKIRGFVWYEEVPQRFGTGTQIRQRLSVRGDVLDISKLSDRDRNRAEELDVFAAPGEPVPDPATPASVGIETVPSQMSVEELEAWILDAKPSVDETLAAADGDPDAARRILDAENRATGNDPRKGVVDGVARIAGSA